MADNAAQRSFFVSLLAVISLCTGTCFKKRVPAKKNKSCKLFGWLRGRFGRRGKPKNIKQNSKPENIQEGSEKRASVKDEPAKRNSIHEETNKRVSGRENTEERDSVLEVPDKTVSGKETEKWNITEEEPVKRDSGEEELEGRESVLEELCETASGEEPERRASIKEEPVKRASEEEPDKTVIVKEPAKTNSTEEERVKRDSGQKEPEQRESCQKEPHKTASGEEHERRSSIEEEPVKRASEEEPEKMAIVKEPAKTNSIGEEPRKRESGQKEPEQRESGQEKPHKTVSGEETERRSSIEEEPVKRANEEPEKTAIVKEDAKTTSTGEEPMKRDNDQEEQDKTAIVEEEEQPEKRTSNEEDPVRKGSGRQKPETMECGPEEPDRRANVKIEGEKRASMQQTDLQGRKTIPSRRRTRNRTFLKRIKELVTTGNPNAKYALTNKIGEGVSGSVYVARDLLNSGIVAIKKIWVSQLSQQRQALEEIVALSSNKHPNITSYIESYLVFDELWIVMEYVDGGCLRDLSTSTRMDEGHITTVVRECLQALQFLHNNKVIHRDVKTENILFGLDGSIKLADFGLCANLSEDEIERVSYVGTPHMMAPEIVTGKEYSFKVDVWSLGITVLEMLDHEHPFLAQSSSDALDFISHTGKPEISRYKVSAELQDFLDKCLEVDSTTRWSTSELLVHPFLQKASSMEDLRTLIMNVKQAV